MIFGTHNDTRAKRQRENAILRICGRRRFAYLPTRMDNGLYIWWGHYFEYTYGNCRGPIDSGELFYTYGSEDAMSPLVSRRAYWSKHHIQLAVGLYPGHDYMELATPDEINALLAEQARILGDRHAARKDYLRI